MYENFSIWYVLLIILAIIGVKEVLVYAYENFKSPVCVLVSLIKEYIYPRRKLCLKEKFGSWAVITGSTDGIGRAYSRELARKGINIVLISRSKEKLIKTSKEIENEFHVKVKYIEADLSQGRDIYDKIKSELSEIDVGILVNNVGQAYDYPVQYFDVPEDKIWSMFFLNIGATAIMTRIVINEMKAKRKGAIVNIGSLLQDWPGPYNNMYAAGKAFVKSFTIALQIEMEPFDVTVQLLNPGFIRTNMTNFTKDLVEPNFFVADVEKFARSAVFTLGRTNQTSGSIYHGIQLGLADLSPPRINMYVSYMLAICWHREYLEKHQTVPATLS